VPVAAPYLDEMLLQEPFVLVRGTGERLDRVRERVVDAQGLLGVEQRR
jgi:hypothetical protein